MGTAVHPLTYWQHHTTEHAQKWKVFNFVLLLMTLARIRPKGTVFWKANQTGRLTLFFPWRTVKEIGHLKKSCQMMCGYMWWCVGDHLLLIIIDNEIFILYLNIAMLGKWHFYNRPHTKTDYGKINVQRVMFKYYLALVYDLRAFIWFENFGDNEGKMVGWWIQLQPKPTTRTMR